MKPLLLFLLVLFLATNCLGQWVAGPHKVPLLGADARTSDFDRPQQRANQNTAIIPHPMPSPEISNWPFQNIDVTNSNVEQDEPMVAINPVDSLNIIIGANDDRDSRTLWAYASTDGGRTWANNSLPIPFQWMLSANATDPSLAFTSAGEVLYVNGHSFGEENDVACFSSSDKGIDWQTLSDIYQDSLGDGDTISDKFFVAADRNPSSPHFGRVYATWVELEDASGYVRVVSAYSDNNGISWSARHYLSGLGHYIAPVPMAEPDGTLLVSFEDYYPNNTIYVARSTDGGNTFEAPEKVASYRNLGPIDPPDSTGYQNIGPPDSALGVNSFPALAVDVSPAHPGRAYMVWSGKGDDSQPHVWLSKSDNDGISWDAPRAIEGDSVRNISSRFFPWVAVDPTTGNVGIDYYASWMDTVAPKPSFGTLLLQADIYMLHSTDGGVSFASRRISNASFDPITGQDERGPEDIWFIGDYIGIAGVSNTWYPVWADGRSDTDLDIYTSIVQPLAPLPVTQLAVRDTIVNGKRASLITWQYAPQTTFGYPLPNGYEFNVAKDDAGFALLTSGTLSYLDTNAQSGHEYEVTVFSGTFHSVTDSVANRSSSVAEEGVNPNSYYFLNSPAIAGREDELILNCSHECQVSLTFYDALGRIVLPNVTDNLFALHHEISFSPDEAGVRFFILKELSSEGTSEITGKISTIGE